MCSIHNRGQTTENTDTHTCRDTQTCSTGVLELEPKVLGLNCSSANSCVIFENNFIYQTQFPHLCNPSTGYLAVLQPNALLFCGEDQKQPHFSC